jgi:hypothetical protein
MARLKFFDFVIALGLKFDWVELRVFGSPLPTDTSAWGQKRDKYPAEIRAKIGLGLACSGSRSLKNWLPD